MLNLPPSVRLFEAAACGTPIISDYWDGLDEFFEPGLDILIARSADHAVEYLRDIPDGERAAIGARGRTRVLARHTAAHRAAELEDYARAQGRDEVSSDLLREVRERMPIDFSKRRPYFLDDA